ncbi:IS200/IS605 family transposase [Thermodesulfobacteriota bacterium]
MKYRMELKRTSHAVYETKYHMVWDPKYRKWILRDDIQNRVKEIFEEIAENHNIEIDPLEVEEDVIRRYVRYHRKQEKPPRQLKLF